VLTEASFERTQVLATIQERGPVVTG